MPYIIDFISSILHRRLYFLALRKLFIFFVIDLATSFMITRAILEFTVSPVVSEDVDEEEEVDTRRRFFAWRSFLSLSFLAFFFSFLASFISFLALSFWLVLECEASLFSLPWD